MQGTGMDLRALQSIYMYPTLVIFASGKGIATAKALVEAVSDANGLDLPFRQSVRLYYRVRLGYPSHWSQPERYICRALKSLACLAAITRAEALQ